MDHVTSTQYITCMNERFLNLTVITPYTLFLSRVAHNFSYTSSYTFNFHTWPENTAD